MRKIYLLFVVMLFAITGTMGQASNYVFNALSGTYVNTSGTATLLPLVRADSYISPFQNIGFTFVFDGVSYTQFKMSSNGFISFGSGTSVLTTNNFSTANSASRPIIAPLWDDLDGATPTTSVAAYEVTGSSPNRVLTVEWRDWEWNWNSAAATISFQCKLYETTNVIEFVYRQEAAAVLTGSASIGISSVSAIGGAGTYLNLDNSSASPTASSTASTTTISTKPATGQIYRFAPPLPCTGSPNVGAVAPTSQNVCAGSTPTALVASGFSTGGSGYTFQWQEATDLAFTTPVNAVGGTGATTATYTPPAFAGTNIYYRCLVTCGGSGLSTASNVASVLTPAIPSTQASAIVVIPAGTTATINWTSGNGGRRYVVVNTTNSFTDPVGTADVTGVNSVYTSGEQIVYDGTASTVSVTGLTTGTTYFVRVYEYQRCTGTPNVNYYNITTATNNPNSFTTLIPPVNDLICNAIDLVVNDPTPVCVNTTLATYTVGQEPDISAACSTPNNTVWYKFTPTVSGIHSVIASVPASSLNGMSAWLYTYTATGTCPGALTLTAAGGLSCTGAPSSAIPGTTTTVATTSLTAGTTYYIYVDGNSGDFGDVCLRVAGPAPMTYVSSTTTQPTTTTVNAGSSNQDVIRLEVTVTGTLTPLSMSQINFNTNGTTVPANITNARVYYTGTSTTFSTTTPFGAAIANPSGSFSATGSQVLTGGLTNTVNYFWLAYDIDCAAVNPNVVDAECTSFDIGSAQVPTATAPTGSRTINTFVSPVVATNQPSTASVSPGSVNNQVLRVDIPASSCLGTITQLDFTNVSTAVGDVSAARVYYTTSTTFATTNLFGTASSTGATFSVTGSQVSAGTGTNYFWLVYDINCAATATNTVDGGCTNVVATLGNFVPGTPNPTGTRAIAAATSNTTIANGEWNNPATWACGAIPPTNTTAVTIAHNITVSNTGNVGGSVTINSGASLTINTGGELTLGIAGGGNRILTNNGTLAVTGGTLNQNGSLLSSSSATFEQSGGDIFVDGNDGTSAGSVPATSDIFGLYGGPVNVTGGTLTIVDPHFSGSAATDGGAAFAFDALTSSSRTFGANHTTIFGGTTGVNTSTATSGFYVDTYVNSSMLNLGNVIINGGTGSRTVNTNVISGAGAINIGGSLTINSGCILSDATSGTTLAKTVTGNIVNNGTFINRNNLILASISPNTTSAVANPNAQSIGGTGTFSNLAASPTANITSMVINNSSVSGVTLNTPISVSGTLTMTAGVINTSTSNLLTLGFDATNAGTLTYTAGRVNGPFKRWITAATGARQFPVGNATLLEDANINFTVAPTTAGSLTAQWVNGDPGFPNVTPLTEGTITNINKASLVGSWIIDAGDGLAGGTYSSTFRPLGAPDVLDFTRLVLLKRPTAGGDWVLDGTHVTTTGSNTAPVLSRTGMTGFSQFAIGGELNVALPVTLSNIRGEVTGATNTVYWTTSTEVNNRKFVVERSTNGSNFTAIGDVATRAINGNSSTALQYSFVDANPLQGKVFYRLQMVDNGGRTTYSQIVTLRRGAGKLEIVDVRPNPTTGTVYFNVLGTSTNVNVAVRDLSGKEVIRKGLVQSNGFSIDMSKLANGMYILEAVDVRNGEKAVFKVMKQ